MSIDLDLLCISAMSGQFAGHGLLEQLWAAILQALPAPLTSLPSRWGIAADRFGDKGGAGGIASGHEQRYRAIRPGGAELLPGAQGPAIKPLDQASVTGKPLADGVLGS